MTGSRHPRGALADRYGVPREPVTPAHREPGEPAPSLIGPLVLAAATALVAVLLLRQPYPTGAPHVPWWLLMLAFALAELEGGGTRSPRLSLTPPSSRVPLVIGLVLDLPLELLAAQLAGVAIVRAVKGGTGWFRASFYDLAGSGFATALGAATYLWINDATPTRGPGSWLAAVVAAAVVVLVSTLLGWLRSDRMLPFGALLMPPGGPVLLDLAGISAGLVVAEILRSDRFGVLLLLIPAATVAVGRQRFRDAAWRAEALTSLHEVASSLHETTDRREAASIVLARAPALTRADGAELTLADGMGGLLIAHARDGRIDLGTRPMTEDDRSRFERSPSPARAAIIEGASTERAPWVPGVRPPGRRVRSGLRAPSRGEELVVGIVERGTVTGTLRVGKRRGVAGFTRAERDLLETLAAILGLQLETMRRLDEFGTRRERDAASVRRLREANQQLARVNAAKSVFLATTSHELRAPLSALLAGTEVLGSSVAVSLDREVVERLADAAHENAQRLLRLVDDLLDLSRIEAGHLELRREPTDLAEIAVSVVAAFEPIATERGARLLLERWADVPVVGDPQRLWQVIANLVDNATKAAAGGGSVTICVALVDDVPQVCVVDTGIGIAPQDRDRIFEPFEQVTSRRGGLGLGLPIARYLVERHGGKLTVHSRPGAGSRFTVRLPPPEGPSRAEGGVAAAVRRGPARWGCR
jgi:signal transduction histidine kinase